ncbi:MAG: CoB--CoM heterodisulfide reductase iron-sulfur subunit A family protein [Chloroflexi bacterium]|nr:CoB--CoM heterodisulfide reductase iron-sulfur subunit A family protein [Chloroflexota bacterium]
MEPRIGVYICHCGSNIAGTVDVAEVSRFAKDLDSVAVARDYKFMCSEPGQNLIKEDIKTAGLNRIIVASCSPKLHEPTFRRVCQDAGINPYLFQMANIREQCSWVTEDHDGATGKAKALVSAAVRRIYYHDALEVRQVPINPDTLVVGGGIAGIQAALKIADSGHKVYLVERTPSIGGHMAQLDKTFPTLDCSACILTPKMTLVGSHPHVELMTYSEVGEVSGYIGNFKVKIRKKARYVDKDKCTGCGLCQGKCPWKAQSEFDLGLSTRKAIYTPFAQAVPNIPVIDTEHCAYFLKGTCRACEKFCEANAIDFEQKDEIIEVDVGNIILATGYDVFKPSGIYEYGYGKLANVITSLEFERLVNSAGPTQGEIVLKDGSHPESVAIIHCAGSRDENYHEYCSRVCCMYSMKFGHLIREHIRGAKVYEFYADIRSFGKGYEEFYNRVTDEGTVFVKARPTAVTDSPEKPEEEGKLIVHYTLKNGSQHRQPVDMVIISTALEPQRDMEAVSRQFGVSRSADGFFLERHPKMDPVATMSDGIFVVGCCQGPKDIPDTISQASAAAARVMAMISKGQVEVEATTAVINEERCAGCRTCEGLCPFKAISFDTEKSVSQVNEALCKGCGVCVAACPSNAITGKHFTTEQIMAEIAGILLR